MATSTRPADQPDLNVSTKFPASGPLAPRSLSPKSGWKLKALVAVARSILVVVWHLLADPTDPLFRDLGPHHYTSRISTQRQIRNHIRQLAALGYTITVEPAA